MQDFKKLKVWRKSHELTLAVYRVTSRFPKNELYGLTSQLRRSSASIPANIAEGCGRDGKAELGRFLRISTGSASELEYHLLLAHELGLFQDGDYKTLESEVVEIRKMLTSLIRKIRS